MQRSLSLIVGITLAIGSVGFVCYDAWAWHRAANVVDSGFRRLATTATNERPGGILLDPDSYYWLSYAKRIGEGETLRVRYTFADNAPYGRPVHWSQSVSWLLVIFGKVRQSLIGGTWSTALEESSVWLNPLLLILLTCGVGWAVFRRIGSIPAGLFMFYLVTLGDVGWMFQPLRPGHHALYCLFGMLMLAGLVLGGAGWIGIGHEDKSSSDSSRIIRPLEVPEFRSARRWFLFSGVCAAFGLWISAVVLTMFLGLLFAAALLLAFCAPPLSADSRVQTQPELWRWWGWAAGAGSFLLYLVEYFPNHLALFRLEVNGPFYSLAVIAMGEALCQFLRARYAEKGHATAALIKGALCTAIVVVVPLAIFFGPDSWHALRDPQMLRLHSFIEEFYSLPRFAGARLPQLFVERIGMIPLFLLFAIALAAFSDLPVQEWAVIWLSFALTIGLLGIAYLQVRWIGLFAAMNVWLGLVTGISVWRLLGQRVAQGLRAFLAIAVLLLLLIQPVALATVRCRQIQSVIDRRTLPNDLVRSVLNKRLALALREEERPGARVMAALDLAPSLHYFGEAAGVASYYWENLDGLHAATNFFADPDGKGAYQIALERGLTHIIIEEGNRWQNYFYSIATGKTDEEAAGKTFAAKLVGSEYGLPDWVETTPNLQRMGSQLYTYYGMRFDGHWRVYRVRLPH